jgi:hypothetical protein
VGCPQRGTLALEVNSDGTLKSDWYLCERIQSGMQAEHSSGGQLVPMERVIGDFHRYLALRLFEGKPPDRS